MFLKSVYCCFNCMCFIKKREILDISKVHLTCLLMPICFTKVQHQVSLKSNLSVTYSYWVSLLLLQAINNYSLTVEQNEAIKKSSGSPTSLSSGDARQVGAATPSSSLESSVSKVYVYEGLLGKTLIAVSMKAC